MQIGAIQTRLVLLFWMEAPTIVAGMKRVQIIRDGKEGMEGA